MGEGESLHTFVFTDIEGSTALLARLGASAYADVVSRHLALVQAAVDSHGGRIIGTEGDGTFLMFSDPRSAVEACVDAQRALLGYPWDHEGGVRVRMGAHVGPALLVDERPVGVGIHHAARVVTAAHGGQIVVSDAIRSLITDGDWLDLGLVALRDFATPVRLYQVAAVGLPREFPPVRAERTGLGNLPRPLTSCVGRDADIAGVRDAVARSRLVTLVGPGGAGKTRLAVEAARLAAPSFPDGVWFVDLAAITDPAHVTSAMARGVGMVSGEGEIPDAVPLLTLLRNWRALLVVDNCEHVIDPVAAVVERVFEECPGVHQLATSQAPLRLLGEQEWPVPPLSDGASRHLFAERARLVDPTFSVQDAQHAELAALCERLDGLPLAIELAAARVRTFTIDEINDRLTTEGATALATSARHVPARHRTLERTLTWTVDLLDRQERHALTELSVFPASFDLRQAERVLTAGGERPTDDVLESLVVKSVVVPALSSSGRRRYRLLNAMRRYAARLLHESGTDAEVRRRHLDATIDWARRLRPVLEGPDPKRAVDELCDGEADLRSAFATAEFLGDSQALARLVTASGHRGLRAVGVIAETPEWIDRALATDPPFDDETRLVVLTMAILLWRHPIEILREMCHDAAVLADRLADPVAASIALVAGAWLIAETQPDEATRRCIAAFDLVAQPSTVAAAAHAANDACNHLRRAGRFDEAFSLLDRLDRLSPGGLGLREAAVRYQRGNLHAALGEWDEARRWFEVSRAAEERTGCLDSYGHYGLGIIAQRDHDWALASAMARQGHERDLRGAGQDGGNLAAWAIAEAYLGNVEWAAAQLVELESEAQRLQTARSLSEYHLAAGHVWRAHGRRDEARTHLAQVLELAPQYSGHRMMADTYAVLAEMADEDGGHLAAAELRDRAAALPRN